MIIGNGVTSIGNDAFYYCESLKTVVIGEGVESIGDNAFSYCIALESIVIPDSVISIGNDAFRACSNLKSVVIGNSVTSIGDYAFWNCANLESIVIPETVTSIGSGAFMHCAKLDIINFLGTKAQWEAISFGTEWDLAMGWYKVIFGTHVLAHVSAKDATCVADGCTEHYLCTDCGAVFTDEAALNQINVADTVVPAKGHNMCQWKQTVAPTCVEEGKEEGVCSACDYIEERTLSANGHDFAVNYCTVCGERRVSEGLEFTSNGDGTCYVSGIGNCVDVDISIPKVSPDGDIVTGIGNYAFDGYAGIESLDIPDTVTSIGEDIFLINTELKAVYIT